MKISEKKKKHAILQLQLRWWCINRVISSIFIEQEGVWMIKNKQIREITEVAVLTGCQIGKTGNGEWKHVMEEGI